MIDFILIFMLIVIGLLIGVMILSKGECHYCGYKFKDSDHLITKKNGKKQCDRCWLNDS